MKTAMFALALSIPGVAAAQSAAGSTEPAPTAAAKVPPSTGMSTVAAKGGAKNDPTKIICRTRDTLGSRLGGNKECHTRAEWYDINRQAGDDLDRRLRVPNAGSAGG